MSLYGCDALPAYPGSAVARLPLGDTPGSPGQVRVSMSQRCGPVKEDDVRGASPEGELPRGGGCWSDEMGHVAPVPTKATGDTPPPCETQAYATFCHLIIASVSLADRDANSLPIAMAACASAFLPARANSRTFAAATWNLACRSTHSL